MSVRWTNAHIFTSTTHVLKYYTGASVTKAVVTLGYRNFLYKWKWIFRLECLVAQVSQTEQLDWRCPKSFRPLRFSEDPSLWTRMSSTVYCPALINLSGSSLWTKEENVKRHRLLSFHKDKPTRTFSKLWVRVHVAAPGFHWAFEADCSRSQHPGSSSILPQLMFHLFQLTSSTLRQQDDTCFNYCLQCDDSKLARCTVQWASFVNLRP